MLITCPYCGPRDVSEFAYQGDGNRDQDVEGGHKVSGYGLG